MALNLKEKRFYQDQVESGLETLDKEGLPIKEKRAAQDQVLDALEKLDGNTDEKTLYQRLVDGEFNDLQWGQFADMCDRIVQEENVPWKDIHEYILSYLDENEPEGGYNWDAILQAA